MIFFKTDNENDTQRHKPPNDALSGVTDPCFSDEETEAKRVTLRDLAHPFP